MPHLLSPEFPRVGLDDRAAYPESQAKAIGLGGEEWIKDPFDVVEATAFNSSIQEIAQSVPSSLLLTETDRRHL